MGINVNVPTAGNDDVPSYLYRVQVKMFWYTPGGSVQGTATHLVDWYKNVLNGWPLGRDPNVYKDNYPCDGWQGWEIA